MIPNILMLVGGLVWLAGEIFGVVRDRSHPTGLPDTTSGWVWLLAKKWAFARILVALGLAILGTHFLVHWP